MSKQLTDEEIELLYKFLRWFSPSNGVNGISRIISDYEHEAHK